MGPEIRRLCISPDVSIEEAARKVAEGGEKIALVVDSDFRLLGVFVDGDLRRALLKHIPITRPVKEVMTRAPRVCYSYELDAALKAKEMMLEHRLEHIPVLDEEGRLVDLYLWRDFFARPKLDTTHRVVIMAGGKGSRLDPFTKILPKPLIPIGDKPIVEHIMERFSSYGYRHFVLSVNYRADMIKMYFMDNRSYVIDYVQEDNPLGTAGSLSLMKDMLDRTFFITNCDIIVDDSYERMLRLHQENQHSLTVVVSQKQLVVPYGVMQVSNDGLLEEIVEKPAYNFLVNTGFYIAEPSVLDYIPEDCEYSMVDLIKALMKDGKRVGVFPIEERNWFDVGQWNEYKRTLRHFGALLDNEPITT